MTKQTIEVGQYTAAYTSIGEGVPIILLHGFFGDSSTLKLLANKLSDNHCCICLELLGFGDSSKPDIRYLIEHQVDFLREFLHVKKIPEFYLVGYSYGAWMAAAYAISTSERSILNSHLIGMILVAPAGIRDDSFVGRYDHLRPLLLWQTPLVELVLNFIAPFAKLAGQSKSFNTILEARKAIATQPAARSILIDRLNPEDAVDTVENEIDRVTIPTLVIAGEIDGTIPLWHSQTYAEKIPQASLVVIAGADHDLVQTHANEVTGSILKFWNR